MTTPWRPPAGLLAFDTSTAQMSVAACGPAGTVGRVAEGGAAASGGLLSLVRAVMTEAGLAPADVRAVAFGAGPGAFTGLRTACAAAQGLALGWDVPVLPLDSLAIVAEDSPWQDGHLWVAMDARMDEVYAAAYRREGGAWTAEVAPALYTLPALSARWQADPPTRVAGTAAAAFGDRLPCGAAALHGEDRDRAAALLRCAAQAWHAGQGRDAAEALPVYLRDKVALTTVEREAAREAKALAAGETGT